MRDVMTGVLLALMVSILFTAGAVSAQRAGKVDINLADSAALQELPGIGPAMALRIIEYREANGPFKRIEDLMEVKGIGEKRFLNLQEMIVVNSSGGEKGDEGKQSVEQ